MAEGHALKHFGLLGDEDHGALRRAYVFLRDVENKLQMVADAQVHSLPASSEEVRLCALRLGYPEEEGADAGEALLRDHRAHTAAVNGIFTSVFSGGRLDRASVARQRRR